jgi:hypothetical protein
MFGLMRPRSCGGKQEHRLYYCGACKTLGSAYGQKSRMLLNHDTVFLAELLGELGAAPAEWGPAYRSFHCMSMPKDVPPVLDYAAAATIVLTQWKIADHTEDTGKRRWRIAQRLFDKTSRKAAARLRGWKFPLDAVELVLRSQAEREANAASVDEVAYPTAHATALFFEHGATIAGRDELAPAMHALGKSFGELVYLLDAFEDFEKDLACGSFNALRTLGLDRAWARTRLHELAAAIERSICDLPTSESFRSMATARLRSNLAAKLGEQFPLFQHRRVCGVHRETWRERWRKAVVFAREMRDRENPGWLKGAAVVASVSFVAFTVPQWAKGAHTSRECLSLGFNLMAIGSVFASVSQKAAAAAGKQSRFKGCCGGCCPDACDCDGCDCCCECGACDSCGGCCDCGSCDCGSCDC